MMNRKNRKQTRLERTKLMSLNEPHAYSHSKKLYLIPKIGFQRSFRKLIFMACFWIYFRSNLRSLSFRWLILNPMIIWQKTRAPRSAQAIKLIEWRKYALHAWNNVFSVNPLCNLSKHLRTLMRICARSTRHSWLTKSTMIVSQTTWILEWANVNVYVSFKLKRILVSSFHKSFCL